MYTLYSVCMHCAHFKKNYTNYTVQTVDIVSTVLTVYTVHTVKATQSVHTQTFLKQILLVKITLKTYQTRKTLSHCDKYLQIVPVFPVFHSLVPNLRRCSNISCNCIIAALKNFVTLSDILNVKNFPPIKF